MRIGTLIAGLGLGLALAMHCSAKAAGTEAWDARSTGTEATGTEATGKETWGAEVAKPDGAAKPVAPRKSKTSANAQSIGRVTLSGDRTATMARVELEPAATYDVFTLPNPYRVIIEVAGTSAAEAGAKGEAHGLVERYHSGRVKGGNSRIIMETLGPVKATLFPADTGADGRIIVEVALTPMPAQDFGEGSGSLNRPAKSAAPATPDFGAIAGGGKSAAPLRPVIVIDPGHGGIDPGAVGGESLLEKNIVMAVAEKLKQALDGTDRYQVHLTRTTDTFISLDQRVGFSRKLAANLFISLHADSIEAAQNSASISGATVYTLSERASDEQARIMAEKENASDLLGGITANSEEDNEVKDILIDLIKRETASFSAEFAGALRAKLGKSVPLSRDPMRSAAFKVLKQPHAPSVLLELGYMSNASDAKRLNSPEWQNKVASAIAAAVDAYFASRTARAK